MKTSVVLTTYNGEKYLLDLLDSLRLQTVEIDEVLICDDCSTDRTVAVLEDYIRKNRLMKWRIITNDKNVGWERNFKNGLLNAKYDIVFPCDQDDIWFTTKVEKMLEVFGDDSCILVASDYLMIGADSKVINTKGSTLDTRIKLHNNLQRLKFDEHFYSILRPGCTMAFRKEILDIFRITWGCGTPHDAVLWSVAVLLDGLYLLREPLVYYRRHDKNASNKISHSYIYKLNEAERTIRIIDWYSKSAVYDKEKEDILIGCKKWCDLRVRLLKEHDFIKWFELWLHKKYYVTIKKWFADLYYFFRGLEYGNYA